METFAEDVHFILSILGLNEVVINLIEFFYAFSMHFLNNFLQTATTHRLNSGSSASKYEELFDQQRVKVQQQFRRVFSLDYTFFGY